MHIDLNLLVTCNQVLPLIGSDLPFAHEDRSVGACVLMRWRSKGPVSERVLVCAGRGKSRPEAAICGGLPLRPVQQRLPSQYVNMGPRMSLFCITPTMYIFIYTHTHIYVETSCSKPYTCTLRRVLLHVRQVRGASQRLRPVSWSVHIMHVACHENQRLRPVSWSVHDA